MLVGTVIQSHTDSAIVVLHPMILIVDDQKDAGTALERLLRHAGHEAVSVTGGAEALAMLYIRLPALVVLDVNMPDMDGLTVLRTIKGTR